MGIVDSIKRRLPEDLVTLAAGLAETQTHWGRILTVRRGVLGRSRILLEIHDLDLPPFERWVSTRIPKGRDPQAGDDVYVVPVRGDFYGVDRPYRIRWDRPPKYGTTKVDLAGRAQKMFIGDTPSLPDPLAALEQERARGTISQADYEAARTGSEQ